VPEDPLAEDIPYRAILTAIVKRFVRLVGAPAALNVARKIPHLSVDDDGNVLDYDKDDPLASITTLIDQYGAVFGDIARTLAQQAAQPLVETANEDLWQATGMLAATMAGRIEVLLVDDHVLFREGLNSLLATQPDVKIVGQAGSVQEAIRLAHTLKPMVVLMDITLPDGTGLEATQAILADLPETKIIFLTVHEDDERLFAAIRAGAMGFLSKDVRAAELLKRLHYVVRGEAGISPTIARRILEEFSRTPVPRPADASQTTELTSRENEVVRELARGATNREIATKFVISENTVKNHVRSVLSKLHLRSRRDVGDYARDHGLTPPFR
jgi:DNA-binding NarL/FixJ family response regulator